MKVGVQWSLAQPRDWTDIDLTVSGPGARRWRDLPKRPVPRGGETIDNQPGWIFAAVVDGVVFAGHDHLAFAPHPGGGVEVWCWTDDLADDETDYRFGEHWLIHPHRPDPAFGGQVNTHQVKTVYAEDLVDMARFFPQSTSGGPVELRPWSEWPAPDEALVRHGIWLDEALMRSHLVVARPRSWREW